MLEDLGSEKIALVKKSLYLDFGFLVLYSLSIAMGCIVLSRYTQKAKLITLGKYCALGVVVAGACDAIENISLLKIAAGVDISFEPFLAGVCAGLKFLGVLTSLLFILTTLGISVWIKAKGLTPSNRSGKSDQQG